jgi:hypothetical protein
VTGDIPAYHTNQQQQSSKPQVPTPLQWSRWLWVGSAGLGAVRSVLELADRESLIDQLRGRSGDSTQDQLDAMANAAVVFGLLLVAVIFGVYVLLSNRMVAGANWARVLLAVLGGAGIALGTLSLAVVLSGVTVAFGRTVGADDVAFSAAGLLMDAAALALMFLPAANAYLARRSPARNFIR